MRQRRELLRAGLLLATVGTAGCVKQILPEKIANPETGNAPETPTASGQSAQSPTVTTTQKQPTRLVGVSATGTNIDGKYVSTVFLTVEKAVGTEQIDLRDLMVSWSDPGGEYRVVANSVESSKAHGHFGIVPADGSADTSPLVIDSATEQYQLVFDLGRDSTTVDDPEQGVSGRPSFGRRVEAGWTIGLQLTTGEGTTTATTLTVPDAVGGRDSVTLL